MYSLLLQQLWLKILVTLPFLKIYLNQKFTSFLDPEQFFKECDTNSDDQLGIGELFALNCVTLETKMPGFSIDKIIPVFIAADMDEDHSVSKSEFMNEWEKLSKE